MGKVLTMASVVQCPHQGPIVFTSAATLRVGGRSVVLESAAGSATVTCLLSSGMCTKIATFATSATLRDAGSAVVLLDGLKTDKGDCLIVSDGHDLVQAE